MANEKWYVLRVRQGFVAIVAEKLRQLDIEVFVPQNKVIPSPANDDEAHHRAAYVFGRFALDRRLAVTSIPGVLDILGAADPERFDENLFSLKWEPHQLPTTLPK